MMELTLSDEDNMIGSDEELIYSGHLHYIILVKAFMCFISFILLALYIPNIFWNSGYPNFLIGGEFLGSSLLQYALGEPTTPSIIIMGVWFLSAVSVFLGIVTMLYYIKVYYSAHLTVTDDRLIIKGVSYLFTYKKLKSKR